MPRRVVYIALGIAVVCGAFLLVREAAAIYRPSVSGPGLQPIEAATAPASGPLWYTDEGPPVAEPAVANPEWPETAAGLALRLIAVLALAYGAIWALRKYGSKLSLAGHSPSMVKVLETTYLAPNKTLHVVQAGRRLLLIGTAQSHIALLAEMDDEDVTETPLEAGGSFVERLQSIRARLGWEPRQGSGPTG